jgi:cytochrome c oxidase cbb3-type subunit 3
LVYEVPEASEEGLKLAKEMFVQNCASCHLQDGGGEIGPNLTDDYWLNKNDINELYKVIKYGKNNMPSWSATFNNEQVYLLSSYVLSLHGTTPVKAKEPEGELKEFLYDAED